MFRATEDVAWQDLIIKLVLHELDFDSELRILRLNPLFKVFVNPMSENEKWPVSPLYQTGKT